MYRSREIDFERFHDEIVEERVQKRIKELYKLIAYAESYDQFDRANKLRKELQELENGDY